MDWAGGLPLYVSWSDVELETLLLRDPDNDIGADRYSACDSFAVVNDATSGRGGPWCTTGVGSPEEGP